MGESLTYSGGSACGGIFMRVHYEKMRRLERLRKPYECAFCPERFATAMEARLHERVCHPCGARGIG